MKVSRIAVAAVAALAAGMTHADTVNLTGASAFSVNQARALKLLCNTNGGTYSLFKTASSSSSLGNIFTAVCTGANFTGSVDQVRVNVASGSYGAVIHRGGNTGATTQAFINPASATCTDIAAGSASLSWVGANEMKNCGPSGQAQEFSSGGFMDIAGSAFRALGQPVAPEVNDGTDFVESNFVQAFGVGVSASLYNAMQAYQVAKGMLPAACASAVANAGVTTYTATGDSTPACQPSISRASMAAMMASGNNLVKRAGANHFIGGTASTVSDLSPSQAISPAMPLLTKFFYCRRPATSGTQVTAQVYFLNGAVGQGSLGGQLSVFGQAVTGDSNIGTYYTARTNPGSSDVRTCLNQGYGAGLLSLENNPVGGSDSYRFVKVNGQSGSEGVAGAAQTTESIAGRYDYQFNAAKYCPGGTCSAIVDAIDSALPVGSSTPGLFLKSESIFSRGGNNLRPLTAKPN